MTASHIHIWIDMIKLDSVKCMIDIDKLPRDASSAFQLKILNWLAKKVHNISRLNRFSALNPFRILVHIQSNIYMEAWQEI